MNFIEIAERRYSCRKYDPTRTVEQEKIDSIIKAARLAPSACNGQPYHITVCKGEMAKKIEKAIAGMGMNEFVVNAPVVIMISEGEYVPLSAQGVALFDNDYRSIDIGIVCAYITAEATAQGLGSCILGWFENERIQKICGIKEDVRLVITLGYAKDGSIRNKKRKSLGELITVLDNTGTKE